jgi:hypothetical protein
VRPLTTEDYLLGRLLAFFSVTFILVCSGQVIILIACVLGAEDSLDYLRDNWLDLPRFLAAGVVIALFTSLLPLAVSSFTTRRAYATAFVIAVFVVSSSLAGILTASDSNEELGDESSEQSESLEGGEPWTGDAAKWLALLDIGNVPLYVSDLILDVELDEENEDLEGTFLVKELPEVVPVLWYLLLTAGLGFALWWRYREMRL